MSAATPEAVARREKHLQYLDAFLAKGFKTLQYLDQLKRQVNESTTLEMLGLGPEKAGKLLAACVAETSLLSALYWVICGGSLLGRDLQTSEDVESLGFVLKFVDSCRKGGGFAPHPGHEADLLSTVSAVQLAVLLKRPEILGEGVDATRGYILSLQLPDGSFTSRAGSPEEGDCRFTFAAMCGLTLLQDLRNQKRGLDTETFDQVAMP